MNSLASGILLQILYGLEPLGVDVSGLLQEVGLNEATLQTEGAWTPAETVDTLWYQAAERTGIRDVGIAASELLRPKHLGAFGYVVAASANVSEAVSRLIRFKRLTGDASTVQLQVSGGIATYVHETPLPPLSTNRHHAEWCSASMVCLLRRVTGQADWKPTEVSFAHPAPPDISEHKRVLGVTPKFSQELDTISMDVSFLAAPFIGAESVLSGILERHASVLLEALPDKTDLLRGVRSRLQKQLSGGNPTLEHVASDLGLSPRSLQRRLEERGSTFQQILDEMREHLAAVYLDDPAMAVSETAYLLGYSDASAFSRAFKRWYQVSPSDWRRSRREGPRTPTPKQP